MQLESQHSSFETSGSDYRLPSASDRLGIASISKIFMRSFVTNRFSILILSAFASLGMLASCGRANTSNATNGDGTVYTSVSTKSNGDDGIATSRRNAITTAIAKASPAVVGINVTAVREEQVDPYYNDPFFQFFGGRGGSQTYRYQVKELGSGFLISDDGYVLTNDHVAGDATKIIVTLSGGVQYDATLVATDHNSDVALLKINASNLPFLSLGNSDDLMVGEWAIALGNPFGLFSKNNKPTVTVGVISNTGVSLGLQEGRNYRDMIQTDAAISSGNSGGPLLNANGEVVGMNSTIISTAQGQNGAGSIGLGFAIPINKIKKLVDGFKSGKHVNHNIADPGFTVMPLTEQARNYFHLPDIQGVVVRDMLRNSAADVAGLQVGDVITGVDKEVIHEPDDLQSVVEDHAVGDVITLKALRNGQTVNVKLVLTGMKQR
jgi:serine protease Do